MIPFFDLTKQYESIQPEIDAATARVLKGGWYILGPEVKAFEKEFADYIGVKHAIGVGSGTEAIHIALLALGIGAGDEVITVPNTAVATVAAIELTGARPVLVDVRDDTMLIDVEKIERAITPRTKAIIPVASLRSKLPTSIRFSNSHTRRIYLCSKIAHRRMAQRIAANVSVQLATSRRSVSIRRKISARTATVARLRRTMPSLRNASICSGSMVGANVTRAISRG